MTAAEVLIGRIESQVRLLSLMSTVNKFGDPGGSPFEQRIARA
jgi:hypothetical protein